MRFGRITAAKSRIKKFAETQACKGKPLTGLHFSEFNYVGKTEPATIKLIHKIKFNETGLKLNSSNGFGGF
jgi:hypothetical protein